MACETHLTGDMVDSDFLPPDYTAIRDDRTASKHGVLIAHRSSIVVTQVEVLDKSCQLVVARVKVTGNPDLYVGSYYRRTNSDPTSLRTLGGKYWPYLE